MNSNALEPWKVVPGEEADSWGISRQSTPAPFKDIAQMMDEDDAREVVRLHNAAPSQEAAMPKNTAYYICQDCDWLSEDETLMHAHASETDHCFRTSAEPAPSLATTNEREEFEKWATTGNRSDLPLNLKRVGEGHLGAYYASCDTNDCWEAWRARAALNQKTDASSQGPAREETLLRQANNLLRSAHEIALRDGKSTNWEAFRNRVHEGLLAQHEYLYPKATGVKSVTAQVMTKSYLQHFWCAKCVCTIRTIGKKWTPKDSIICPDCSSKCEPTGALPTLPTMEVDFR